METTIEQLENGTALDRIIEIKAIYKTTKHTIQPAFDPKTKWWAGVERLSDEQMKARNYNVIVGKQDTNDRKEAHLNTKITLKDGLTFDLNNEVDLTNWRWVKQCPEVAMSFKEAQSSKALFYVHIPGRESEIKNKSFERVHEAGSLILQDPTVNYANRALLLGMDMEGENPSTIKEFLLETASKHPDKIFRIYRDQSMKIHLLFLKGKKSGFIKVDPKDNVIYYGSTILGISDESAIAYLQANTDIMMLLERDVNPEYFNEKNEAVGGISLPEKNTRPLTPIEKAQAAQAAKRSREEQK